MDRGEIIVGIKAMEAKFVVEIEAEVIGVKLLIIEVMEAKLLIEEVKLLLMEMMEAII